MFGGSEYTNNYNGSIVEKIDLAGFDTGVRDDDGQLIYQPNSLKSTKAMFANCVRLTEIDFGREADDLFAPNNTNMSRMFFNCRLLTENRLRDAISKLGISKVEDMSYMFAQYRFPADNPPAVENTTYTFPEDFYPKSCTTIEGMFSNIKDTSKITIQGGESQAVGLQSVAHLFDGCSKITTVDINNCKWLITKTTEDFSYAYANCTLLSDVSFIGKDFGS